jgi:hypothetical protein
MKIEAKPDESKPVSRLGEVRNLRQGFDLPGGIPSRRN